MARHTLLGRDVTQHLLRAGNATRNSLVELLGARPATLTEAVRRLSEEGILEEPERKGKKTGRKASAITLDAGFGNFIGVSVDVDETKAVILDARGAPLADAATTARAGADAPSRQKGVVTLLGRLKKEHPAAWRNVRGIGFSDPGVVDTARGFAVKAVNIPGWRDLPVRDWLEKRYETEVVVVAQCQGQAYAEHLLAGDPLSRSLFFLYLDAGVGGGFAYDGRPLVGDANSAMEIGHAIIERDGPLCQCGNRGCFEAVAGIAGLRRRVEELVGNGVETSLASKAFDVPHFLACVEEGDKSALALATELSTHVGEALALVAMLLNPSTIAIGGRLSGLGDLLVSTVRRTLALRCLPMNLEHLTVRISGLPDNGPALGAALMAREHVLLDAAARI